MEKYFTIQKMVGMATPILSPPPCLRLCLPFFRIQLSNLYRIVKGEPVNYYKKQDTRNEAVAKKIKKGEIFVTPLTMPQMGVGD